MTWVRLDEEFPKHPKVLAAGPLGLAMQVAALCYCNTYLTDGFVPRSAASGLLDLSGLGMRMWSGEFVGGGEDAEWTLVVEDLISAGLWDEVQGGYQIHDFHDYQPTKQDVIELRQKRAEAGRKGGQARTPRTPAKQMLEQMPSKPSSKMEAKQKPVPVPGTDPNPNPQTFEGQPPNLAAVAAIDHQHEHTIKNGNGLSPGIQGAILDLVKALPDATDGTVGRLVRLAKQGAQQADFHDARAGVAATSSRHPSRVACTIITNRIKERPA